MSEVRQSGVLASIDNSWSVAPMIDYNSDITEADAGLSYQKRWSPQPADGLPTLQQKRATD